MPKLVEIEGIDDAIALKLTAAGIGSVDALLERGANPAGRVELAGISGSPQEEVLNWVNRADLSRVKGIGGEYSDLLEAAGVDTVPELAQRNPANLHQKLSDTNDAQTLVQRLPTEEQVADWVDQAKALPRVVSY